MVDDLEEINLAITHSGDSRNIRRGRRHLIEVAVRNNKTPKWQQQLRAKGRGKRIIPKITLPFTDSGEG